MINNELLTLGALQTVCKNIKWGEITKTVTSLSNTEWSRFLDKHCIPPINGTMAPSRSPIWIIKCVVLDWIFLFVFCSFENQYLIFFCQPSPNALWMYFMVSQWFFVDSLPSVLFCVFPTQTGSDTFKHKRTFLWNAFCFGASNWLAFIILLVPHEDLPLITVRVYLCAGMPVELLMIALSNSV